MKKLLIRISLLSLIYILASFPLVAEGNSPLEIAKTIGDKLIRHTPFQYRLVVKPNTHVFSGLEIIDFSRTFGPANTGMAYACTHMVAPFDMQYQVQVDHSGGCKIWLNGEVVYTGWNKNDVDFTFEERSVELSQKVWLHLKKGVNTILVKSTSAGDSWIFCMQPEPDKMKVDLEKKSEVAIGLRTFNHIDSQIADLTNWLVCGVFDEPKNHDLDAPLPIEQEIGQWGRMFEGKNGVPVTWTIPHIDILGDVIDPEPWGTPYNWNYHNGGTAWAMQVLAEVSGEKKYDDYATKFCNFHIDSYPFIAYQVDELKAFDCTNHHIYKTPLLDFTLAPSLPFIYKLISQSSADRDAAWCAWVDTMIVYSQNQIRLPGSTAYTRTTPEVYTTWVDDMFMGIPFLVYASIYKNDSRYMSDAVSQIFDFNKQVWDKESGLYMHARYSNRDVKLPHWSRANGWGLWAVTEVLTHLPVDDSRYQALLAHYQSHVKNLVQYQNERGFWYNVLEYPESREEVSGTAIFTMAMARGIRMGWLNAQTYEPVVEKAWEALTSQIDADGTVHNICYGTMCSEEVDYYINRPFYTDDTHGLFAVLFAGIEMYKLQSSRK